ncbi:MAG: hypothetical protein CSA65_06810 [Proteobacteria bacterium]|nr:MAG: hypothetical protein CSA65_06810 [Pseudomonadota bacterium]
MGMLGTRCGNYVLSELLGRGGMGAVYRAAHPKIGREVAVKVLDSTLSANPEHIKRFGDEAAILARMRHPNIVEIYDFGELPSGQVYFVMELLRGCELKPLMRRRGKMSVEEVAPYLQQICGGLQAAHDQGIVHRDVKPANVFVVMGSSVRVKLLDFGISKDTEEVDGRTQTGMMMGTPTFMAPEQIKGAEPIRPAADIYALGVILYQMLAGKPPFAAASVFSLLAMHLRDEPPPLAECAPHIPMSIAELIYRCLAKEPGDRPASAQLLWELFAEQLDHAGLSMALRHEDVKLIEELADERGAAELEGGGEQEETVLPELEPPELEASSVQPNLSAGGDLVSAAVRRTPLAPSNLDTASAALLPAPPASSDVDTATAAPLLAPSLPFNANVLMAARGATSPLDEQRGVHSPPFEDAPAEPSQQVEADQAREKEALIDQLVAEMRRKGDFPAIAKSIQEIQRNASVTGIASARTLAKSIQKDYALSTKLLRVVNSAYYERSGGRISSVARAVVMLGFEQVRDTAIGLTVFPKVQGPKKQLVVDSAVNALMSGVLAAKFASSQNTHRGEDAFACGLFRTLGRQLVLYYLPTHHDRIIAAAERNRVSEELAARRELGLTYDDLGMAIAKRWRLADVIQDSMRPYDPESAPVPRNDAERLRASAALANDLCALLAETPVDRQEAALERLLERYAAKVKIKPARLTKLVEASLETVREQFGGVVGFELGDSTLFRRLLQVEPQVKPQRAEQVAKVRAARHSGRGALRSGPPPRLLPRVEQGVREVEAALSARKGVEVVLRLAMQTVHEGLELRRVAFMAYTSRGDLEIRAVLGKGNEELKGTVVRVDQQGDDPFSAALVYRSDRLVAGGESQKLPSWCRDDSAGDELIHYLYPIEVFMKPAGLLYADGSRLGKPLMPYLARLRNYITAAMRGS